MAFNLLTTAVFNSSNTADVLSDYAGMSTSKLNALGAAGILSNDQINQITANSSLPVGLSPQASVAAASAGLSATTSETSNTATDSASDIVVKANTSDLTDNRLRLSALQGREDATYGKKDKSSNILFPLYATGGLMFPYTPSVQISGDTDWSPHSLTHTNFDVYSYQRTPSATIGISGKFTVQNQREGEYALACIHFLRTMGKMYYGEQDSSDYQSARDQTKSNAGLPPPVMRLRGYGQYMFCDLKCVLKSYSLNYEETMDLVTITSSAGGDVMLPAMFTLNVNILLQQNQTRLRKDFKLDDFRTGALMKQGGWF